MKTFFGKLGAVLRRTWVWSLLLVLLLAVVVWFVGPLLAGASFDLTDSYGAGFVIVAAMFATAAVTLTQVGGPEPGTRKTG